MESGRAIRQKKRFKDSRRKYVRMLREAKQKIRGKTKKKATSDKEINKKIKVRIKVKENRRKYERRFCLILPSPQRLIIRRILL